MYLSLCLIWLLLLQISKTLVDVQLENNRIQEDAEAYNFDLNNKVHVEYRTSAFQGRNISLLYI